MTMQLPTYIEAISNSYPTIQCSCQGEGCDYSSIVWEAGPAIPSQSELDVVIATMTKDKMWKLIQVERDRRKNNGVKVGTDWFHSDDTSRIQQLGLVMFGANMPANIMWKTLAGNFVLMTPTLAGQIFQAVAASDMAIFGIAEQHKAAMMVSAEPQNYNYMSGWPLTFGE